MARIFASCAPYLAVAVVLIASRSSADTTDRGAGEAAVITLIAEAGRGPELPSLLNELLERDDIEVRFVERARFGSSELLDTPASEGTVAVFVVPSGRGAVRIYFRAADGERFLVREVALASGFDALGRELIAQIVETSLVSLLHTTVGITRMQVKAELASAESAAAQGGDPRPAPQPVLKPAAPSAGAPPSTLPRSKFRRLEAWCAARYGAEWSGSALGVAHGPALELGLGVRLPLLVRTRLTLERDFPVTLAAGPIDAHVTTSRWRAGLDVGVPLGKPTTLLLSFGAGQDASRIEPFASRSTSLTPAAVSHEAPAVVRSELRFETGTTSVQLALAAVLDVPLAHTPYDVDRGANAKQLAEPWSVRPGAALALAFRPQFAWF
jgi:hypothetical protein